MFRARLKGRYRGKVSYFEDVKANMPSARWSTPTVLQTLARSSIYMWLGSGFNLAGPSSFKGTNLNKTADGMRGFGAMMTLGTSIYMKDMQNNPSIGGIPYDFATTEGGEQRKEQLDFYVQIESFEKEKWGLGCLWDVFIKGPCIRITEDWKEKNEKGETIRAGFIAAYEVMIEALATVPVNFLTLLFEIPFRYAYGALSAPLSFIMHGLGEKDLSIGKGIGLVLGGIIALPLWLFAQPIKLGADLLSDIRCFVGGITSILPSLWGRPNTWPIGDILRSVVSSGIKIAINGLLIGLCALPGGQLASLIPSLGAIIAPLSHALVATTAALGGGASILGMTLVGSLLVNAGREIGGVAEGFINKILCKLNPSSGFK